MPKVAGRSGQWIEAEGRGSAAGTPEDDDGKYSFHSDISVLVSNDDSGTVHQKMSLFCSQ